MSRTIALVLLAVLGAGCTGDRPAGEKDPGPGKARTSPVGQPRCEASPGGPPEGFILVRSRDFSYSDHIGVREEYRDEEGRLLVYLLGVTGEMGEGATVVEDLELAAGGTATLFGSGGKRGWSLVWSEEPPCPQIAVVGNGFTRDQFLGALGESGIVAGPS